MKLLTVASTILLSTSVIAQQAEDYYDPAAMSSARETLKTKNGDTLNYLVIAERLENQVYDEHSNLVWEAQAWVGYDLDKLWLKTEGHYDNEENETGEVEFQALWSHAVSPFWDLQVGWRHDFEDTDKDYAVIGLMGLAPYWFEIDTAAFVSDNGDVSARLEAEYEMRLTQRLILQPRMELNYGFGDDMENGIGQGFHKVHLGLRLRYEFKREIAPYLGLGWEKSFGRTADLLQAAGKENGQSSVVIGMRLWY